MIARILAIFALFASTASAFVPAATSAAFGVAKSSSVLSMAMQTPELKKNVIAATLSGVMPAIMTSSAAMATDGTNEWFGVDDLRVLGVLFIGHWFILTLWYQQYGQYDESEDFFGEIDYTTSKKN